MELNGKNILLTGASSGIGLELAKILASHKCNLALLNRRINITEKLAEELKNSGSKIISIRCDVSNKNDVIQAVEDVKNHFGKIDIAILNSGIGINIPVEKFNSEDAKKILDVNLLGMIYCAEALIPEFINQKSGMIVGVSSLAEGRGFSKNGIYCASKAAASIFLESIRVELKKYGVKVLTVKPGFVRTSMNEKNKFRMPFLVSADKAAKIIINGIKKEKRIIQFPFPTVIGAKLLRIMPNSIFEMIANRV